MEITAGTDAGPIAAEWVLRIHRRRRMLTTTTEDLAVEIKGARSAGMSWAVIARGLGVTRQAAWTTWHDRLGE